jgi:hypothetical protein
MDLVKSWGAGLLVYVLGAFVSAAVAINAGAADQLNATDGALLWIALPTLLTFLLVAALADLVHAQASDRDRRGRRLLAVLTVPVLTIGLGLALDIARGSGTLAIVVSALASVAGTGLGLSATTWRRSRQSR